MLLRVADRGGLGRTRSMKSFATVLLNDVARNPGTRYFCPTQKKARVSAVSQKPPPRKHASLIDEIFPSGQGMSYFTPRVTMLPLIACARIANR